jgi:hypothetical protein
MAPTATPYDGSTHVDAELDAPEKKVGGVGGGKGRPMEGKMFPRGTGK